MKRKNRVVSERNLPVALPVYQTLILLLLTNAFVVPWWIKLAVGFLLLAEWGYWAMRKFMDKEVDIFKGELK